MIGGNVSLYNESGGHDIDPTPVVGLLGVVDSLVAPPPGWAWREGDTIVLVGIATRRRSPFAFPLGGHALGDAARSTWRTCSRASTRRRCSRDVRLRHRRDRAICAGAPSDVTAVHDVGGGGLAVALAEMAASTGVGAQIDDLRESRASSSPSSRVAS